MKNWLMPNHTMPLRNISNCNEILYHYICIIKKSYRNLILCKTTFIFSVLTNLHVCIAMTYRKGVHSASTEVAHWNKCDYHNRKSINLQFKIHQKSTLHTAVTPDTVFTAPVWYLLIMLSLLCGYTLSLCKLGIRVENVFFSTEQRWECNPT